MGSGNSKNESPPEHGRRVPISISVWDNLPLMTPEQIALSSRTLILIERVVYDVTDYLDEHPGGRDLLTVNHATDCTALFFDARHPPTAFMYMSEYRIAKLDYEDEQANEQSSKQLHARSSSVINPSKVRAIALGCSSAGTTV